MKNLLQYFVLTLVLISCGASKVSSTISSEDFKSMIDAKSFIINANYANPRATGSMIAIQNAGLLPNGDSAGRIDLQGNGNFLSISGDSIQSNLPFFGERQGNIGYGVNEGLIKFNGVLKDYQAVWNEKKQRYDIRFKAQSNNEQFDAYLTIYPNLRSSLALNGSSRTSIAYSGQIDLSTEK